MNQLDLVGGGQQLNRGYKYLIDNEPYQATLDKLDWGNSKSFTQ